STPALDVFAFPGSPSDKATRVIEAMRYAFGEGTLENASIETLKAVFPAALLLADHPEGNGVDPMGLAHRLLGGRGDEEGVRLAALVEGLAGRDLPGAQDAAAALRSLYGGSVTASQRRAMV